jgi:hypothetical protein
MDFEKEIKGGRLAAFLFYSGLEMSVGSGGRNRRGLIG